ncbi:MAG: hypothetical protein QW778_01865 [Candidatus Micrarchaeaceae archaeon]
MGVVEGELGLVNDLERLLNLELQEFIAAPVKLRFVHGTESAVCKGFWRTRLKANRYYEADIFLKDPNVKKVKALYPMVVFGGERAYPLFAHYGTVISSPIPTTIVVKRVTLLRPLTYRRAFIPFWDAKSFNHKKIFKEKLGWNPLIERLNQDKELENLLEKLPNRVSWQNWVQEIKDESDSFEECLGQIIPFKQETLIIFNHAAKWEETFTGKMKNLQLPYIKDLIKIMIKVAQYITEFKYDKEANGIIAEEWSARLLLYLLMKDLKPHIKKAKVCPYCGTETHTDYCPTCGREVKQET